MIEFCTTRYFLSLRDSYSYAVYSQAVPTSLPHSCIRCADSRKGVQKKLKQICETDNPRHCVRRATSEASSSSSSCLRLLNAEENKSDRLSLRNVCRVWGVATLRTRRPKFLLSYQIQMGWNRQMLFSTATPSHTSPARPCCRRGRGGMLSVVL